MTLYKIKAISELSGYPPELLRAWERRYGLLHPVRTTTGHRLYTPADLAVLRQIRRQLEGGRSIGEVAAAGREGLLGSVGGNLDELRARALSCALELNGEELERVLDEAFAQTGPDRVVEGLIIPSAHEMGELWASGCATVAAEHLQSAIYASRLERLVVRHLPSEPVYVVGCLEGEHHELAARLVAYFLSREGLTPLYVAPNLPVTELAGLCATRRPAAVLLSVSREPVLRTVLDRLVEVAPKLQTRLVLGGAGVAGHETRLAAAGVECWPAGRPLAELAGCLRKPA